MFGCWRILLSAEQQQEAFNAVITSTLGDDCEYNLVRNIHETLNEMLKESKDFQEPLALTKTDVRRLFEDSGVPDEMLEDFDYNYKNIAGDQVTFMAVNITGTMKLNIETPDVVIKVDPEYSEMIKKKYIDGRQCLVIPINDCVQVDGIKVSMLETGGKSVSN